VRISRRLFTLIEVIIALSLTAIVMTSLTYFYMQIQEINNKTENSLREIYRFSYLESRLANVIPKAISECSPKNDFAFFTTLGNSSEYFKHGTSNLIFTYDNGIDLNKQFSNHVLARLFLDNQNRLVLATWPSFKRWKAGTNPPMKKEILLENVDNLTFSFFIPPTMDRTRVIKISENVKKKKLFIPGPAGSWVTDWKSEYYELPAMMKVQIQTKGENMVFTFPLPNSNNVIFYTL